MKVPFRQLERHLTDRLVKVYLVAGDEPLLVDEALEKLRAAAKREGFTSRELHTADRSFKWVDLLAGADNLSLFATRKIVEIRLATPKPGDEGAETIAALCEREDPDTLVIVAVGEKLGQASRSSWVKAIEQAGAVVEIWPIERGAQMAVVDGIEGTAEDADRSHAVSEPSRFRAGAAARPRGCRRDARRTRAARAC